MKASLFIASSSLIPSALLVSCTSVHLFSGVSLLKESPFHLVSMLKISSEAAGSFCGRVSLLIDPQIRGNSLRSVFRDNFDFRYLEKHQIASQPATFSFSTSPSTRLTPELISRVQLKLTLWEERRRRPGCRSLLRLCRGQGDSCF